MRLSDAMQQFLTEAGRSVHFFEQAGKVRDKEAA
jgi:hypothetical protein